MRFSKREYIFVGVIVFLLCVTSVSTFFAFFNENDEQTDLSFLEENEKEEADEAQEITTLTIVVDVKGAVQSPGVYYVEQGSRVVDVIEMAGGVLENADVKQINFAEILKDEMVIYVPAIGEEAMSPFSAAASGGEKEKVRINYATSEELQKLPGIGPAKAEAIIRYREEHGPFQTEEDLLNVSGIGAKSFEKIKEEITVR